MAPGFEPTNQGRSDDHCATPPCQSEAIVCERKITASFCGFDDETVISEKDTIPFFATIHQKFFFYLLSSAPVLAACQDLSEITKVWHP
jgi:hypothetical protein